MAIPKRIEIFSIKRVTKPYYPDFEGISKEEKKDLLMLVNEGELGGRFYDRVTFKIDRDKEKKSLDFTHVRNESLDKKTRRLRDNIKGSFLKDNSDSYIERRSNQIAPKSVKTVPVFKKEKGKTVRKQGNYFSYCFCNIIVRYKNQTPFHFPDKGSTNVSIRARNLTEVQALHSVLYGDNLEQFRFWLKKSRKDKNVYIYGGWTYKRTFSKTGSFNGDTVFLDFLQREFLGNNGYVTHNKLGKYRKGDVVKSMKV